MSKLSAIHFQMPIEIRYVETDGMAVVHHSNYAIWFELARIRYLSQLGLDYAIMVSKDWHLPLIELHCKYIKALRFGDRPQLRMHVIQESSTKFLFSYEIETQGQITTTGNTLHAFVNSKGRPIRPPQDFLDLLVSTNN